MIIGRILLLGLIGLLSACAPKTVPKIISSTELKPQIKAESVSALKAEEIEWRKTLEAARKEGRVSIYGAEGARVFAENTSVFKKMINERYGVNLDLEVTSGRTEGLASKLFTERRAGLYLVDIYLAGTISFTQMLKPAGVLDNLEPQLILPEILDPRVYWDGKVPWADKDKKVFPLSASVVPHLSINTSLVREGEIKSYYDLLNPKWRGKIIMDDPTIGGGANMWFAFGSTMLKLPLDYFRQIAAMDIPIIRDKRLQVEWLARGRYSIGIGLSRSILTDFMDVGAPVKLIIPEEGAPLNSSGNNLALINKMPHPSATKIFINWLLTKEGQTVYHNDSHSVRVDVSISKIPPIVIRQKGVKYFDTSNEEFDNIRVEQTEIAREIFGPLFR